MIAQCWADREDHPSGGFGVLSVVGVLLLALVTAACSATHPPSDAGADGTGGGVGDGSSGGTAGGAAGGAAGGSVTGVGGNGSAGQSGAAGAAGCSVVPSIPCPGAEICDLDTPNRCTAGAEPGHCIVLPASCLALVAPVCGCNGQTYNNDCERQRARAQLAHTGACP